MSQRSYSCGTFLNLRMRIETVWRLLQFYLHFHLCGMFFKKYASALYQHLLVLHRLCIRNDLILMVSKNRTRILKCVLVLEQYAFIRTTFYTVSFRSLLLGELAKGDFLALNLIHQDKSFFEYFPTANVSPCQEKMA